MCCENTFIYFLECVVDTSGAFHSPKLMSIVFPVYFQLCTLIYRNDFYWSNVCACS